MSDAKPQILEAQRTSHRINAKQNNTKQNLQVYLGKSFANYRKFKIKKKKLKNAGLGLRKHVTKTGTKTRIYLPSSQKPN